MNATEPSARYPVPRFQGRGGMGGERFFVQLNSPAGFVRDLEVPVLHHQGLFEHVFVGTAVGRAVFENQKIRRGGGEMHR